MKEKKQNPRKGLSEKEISFISFLELKGRYFFTLQDTKGFFKDANERGVYLHRLRKKERVIKLNKSKYFLIPIKARNSKWSEHPFILIDEIMDGKNYCIVGKTAANYWKLIDQIPFAFEVWNTRRHGTIKVLSNKLVFKKHKLSDLPESTEKEIYGHKFIIATKEESKKWK
ncbi:MAG: hypothetical protein KJ718_00945 [Nanoarchaeota archaeon]|nr:hypothetical protein [Nanoarchaeota archaeon]MBU1051103.1 hypothetical protein [Nanoarchaeota archaeon]MBU1987959.1 hypothetical protein [Nanoarchaeota archaeon]